MPKCNECEIEITEEKAKKSGMCKKCWRKEHDKINRVKIREQARAWNIENREKVLQLQKEWKEKNPERCKELWAKSKDKKRFGGNRIKALERDNFECQHCGMSQEQHIIFFSKNIAVHHIDGNGKGSENPNHDLNNLITLCYKCHIKEHQAMKEVELMKQVNSPQTKPPITVGSSEIVSKSLYGNRLGARDKTEDIPKKKRSKKLPVFVSEKDLLEIMKVSKHNHHKLAYMFGFYSGLRISEVLNLEPRDIDMEKGTLFVREGKGGKDRVTQLPEFFREEMFELMPLIKLLKVRALQKAFMKACLESGVLEKKPSVHFHSLRHGFCTHAIEKEIDITRVQVLAGHSNIATTNIYCHLNPKIALDEFRRKF